MGTQLRFIPLCSVSLASAMAVLLPLGCGTSANSPPKAARAPVSKARGDAQVERSDSHAPTNSADRADSRHNEVNAAHEVAPAAPAAPAAEEPPPSDRLIVLLPGGPMLIDVYLTVEGRPHERSMQRLVDLVLTAGDTDENGIPTWDELVANSQFVYGPLARDANAAGQEARQWKQNYDLDRNGFLSPAEAMSWLGRGTGRTARSLALESARDLYYQPRRQSRVWGLLDVDDDGVLSASEIAAATARLLTRDADDNRLLYLHELESLREQLRAADGTLAMAPQRSPDRRAALLLSANEDWQLVSAALADLYAAGHALTSDGFPDRAELFAVLDADGSGRLATAELAELANLPADLALRVDFSEQAASKFATCRIEVVGATPPLVEVLADTGTRLALAVADQHVVVSVHDLAPVSDFDGAAGERLAALDKDESGYVDRVELEAEGSSAAERFVALDADADGMIVREEIADYLRLENAVARSQTQIVVHDQGDALFERLDTDHDGRLGEREVAASAEGLKSLDANGDGRLTAGEIAGQTTIMFVRGPRSQNRDLSQFAVLASPVSAGNRSAPMWFLRGDSNGDGEISRREFIGTQEQFQQLDADGDGWITVLEAQAP